MSLVFFDKRGKFVMPSAEAIAALDDNTREAFAAVQAAATELETATANREAAEQSERDAIAEETAAEKAMPKITFFDQWKQAVASRKMEHQGRI